LGSSLRIDTPVGSLWAEEEDGALTKLLFAPTSEPPAQTPLLLRARLQLEEYFAGRLREFDLPLRPSGTQFQLRDWEALRAIPYGETRTYGQIAAAIGDPKASRAVGMANNRNPICIIIPCHRVIGAGGKLVGYGGGLDVKEYLLRLEGCI
jgi:methylated-DNA-[protein]-cysteine S-methyltransferase